MVSASLTDTNNGLPADTQGPFSSSDILEALSELAPVLCHNTISLENCTF
jgi:hypothetical protein